MTYTFQYHELINANRCTFAFSKEHASNFKHRIINRFSQLMLFSVTFSPIIKQVAWLKPTLLLNIDAHNRAYYMKTQCLQTKWIEASLF